MAASSLETASFWANVAVVVLGVLAAMAAGFALYFSSKLNANKDAKLASFQEESKLAIAAADARAAEANKKAAEAGEGTAKALAEAASANERSRKLEFAAVSQRERAAKAEKDLLELQNRLAWRVLSAAQRGTLVNELSRFAGTSVVVTLIGDIEANQFGKQIVGILDAAKWKLTGNFAGLISPPAYGIICVHAEGDKAAETFVRLLKEEKVLVYERNGTSLEIVIGMRPPA